jgi:transcriptional regulator with XRE-family HTH domain
MSSESAEGSFGSRLKQAREARGLSLRQIAEKTKLSMGTLEALERNYISRLPGGIYTRAVVRSYATEIGLDPERTFREFVVKFPQEGVTAGRSHVHEEEASSGHLNSRRRVLALAVGAVILVAAVVGALLVRGSRTPDAVAASDDGAGTFSDVVPSGTESQVIQTTGAPMVFEVIVTMPLRLDVVVDGARRESRDVGAGEQLVFTAERELTLTVSDAGGLRLTINGQPGVTLGAAGESRSVRIDRDNLIRFLASQ